MHMRWHRCMHRFRGRCRTQSLPFAVMQTAPRPAIVTLRMSRSLRDALHSAAAAEGCSLNGYALQILAAAAGEPARFRSVATEDRLVREHEREDPAFFVEWYRSREA